MLTGGFIFAVTFDGKLYGFVIAVVIILITTIISGFITFQFSKHFFKEFFREKIISKYEKLRQIDMLLKQNGAKVLFLIRLSPIMPLFILNYIFGGFTINNVDYIIGALGSISITVLYVYIGYLTLNIGEVVTSNSDENYSKLSLI